jgi:hypothetical protein
VPNPELKLKPGMTANVNVEIARRTNVVRVPNGALRFRPTSEIYTALGLTPPPAPERGQGAGRNTASASKPAPQQPSSGGRNQSNGNGEDRGITGSATGDGRNRGSSGNIAGGEASPGRGLGDGSGRGRLAERLQGLPPEEREQLLERLKARGFTPEGSGSSGNARGRRGENGPANGNPPGPQSLTARNPQATTIDALFGPLPPVESVGRVWIFSNKDLKAVRVRLGISDGQATELLEGDIESGTELVTNVNTGTETRPATGVGPLFQQPGRGGFPGGGFPGGGGGRGGGGRGF